MAEYINHNQTINSSFLIKTLRISCFLKRENYFRPTHAVTYFKIPISELSDAIKEVQIKNSKEVKTYEKNRIFSTVYTTSP